jgi:hypothetical protein
VLFSFGLVCAACGGTSKTTPTADDTAVCEPGSRRCNGDAIKRCNQSGKGETVELTCATGQCRTLGKDAFCTTPIPCTPNQAMCDENIATQCKADGSGPLPGGEDCSASKQHCLQGACGDALCIPDTKSCHDGDAYLCSTDGSSLSVYASCTDGEVCDEDSGACLPQRCEPLKVTCQGLRAVTCNASGSDWLKDSLDCAAQDKVCMAGRCEERTCLANSTFCAQGRIDIFQCDLNGVDYSVSATCRPGFDHCELTASGSNASCVPDTCVAGQKLCDGYVLKTCNADGSRPKQGKACGKGQVCENAQCKSVGCSQGTLFCKDNDVYECEPSGPVLSETCGPARACLALIPDPEPSFEVNRELTTCAFLPCPPGEIRCIGNKLGTCSADGVSLSTVTEDCALNGQVCSAATDCTLNGQLVCLTPATCAASVTDTLSRDASSEAGQGTPYLGNVIDVSSARKLTELQMRLSFPSPSDLRWIVFEQVGTEFIARAEKTTQAASSNGFVSSGPLSFNYQLEVGKRYALGVILPAGSTSYSAAYSVDSNASFGSAIGNVRVYGADYSSFSIAPNFAGHTTTYMKVTTESP